MTRKNRSLIWEYFTKIAGERAVCSLCNENYAYGSTIGNLRAHLMKKHPAAHKEFWEMKQQQNEANETYDKQKVIYLIAEDHNLSNTDSPETAATTEINTSLNLTDSSPSVLKRKRRENAENIGTPKKRLIEQLTEEKIAVASVQKELMEKQLEETSLKVLLLQEEMEHKKYIYNLEKQEIERKREIQELTKQETLLRIEVLKANLSKDSHQCTAQMEPDMPTIEIATTE